MSVKSNRSVMSPPNFYTFAIMNMLEQMDMVQGVTIMKMIIFVMSDIWCMNLKRYEIERVWKTGKLYKRRKYRLICSCKSAASLQHPIVKDFAFTRFDKRLTWRNMVFISNKQAFMNIILLRNKQITRQTTLTTQATTRASNRTTIAQRVAVFCSNGILWIRFLKNYYDIHNHLNIT